MLTSLTGIATAVASLCAQAGVTITNIPSALPSSVSAGASGVTAISGTASRSASISATRSAAPAASSAAAAENAVVGYGAAIAMGLVGVLAL